MKTGMLWFDDSARRSFDAKVTKAMIHYREKYGHEPTVCYVNSGCLPSDQPLAGIKIVASHDILPDHFWLGLADPSHRTQN